MDCTNQTACNTVSSPGGKIDDCYLLVLDHNAGNGDLLGTDYTCQELAVTVGDVEVLVWSLLECL